MDCQTQDEGIAAPSKMRLRAAAFMKYILYQGSSSAYRSAVNEPRSQCYHLQHGNSLPSRNLVHLSHILLPDRKEITQQCSFNFISASHCQITQIWGGPPTLCPWPGVCNEQFDSQTWPIREVDASIIVKRYANGVMLLLSQFRVRPRLDCNFENVGKFVDTQISR